jgi:CBS domain containing-hemolysin-like protein
MHIRGEVLIEDLNELLGIFLPTEDVVTIGGLVTSELGLIPRAKQEITIGDAVLRVEKMDQNSVVEVSLQVTSEQAERLETQLL